MSFNGGWNQDDWDNTVELDHTCNFEHMEETVDKICKSLLNEPHQWVIGSPTFHKKGTDLEIQHDTVCLFKDTEITRIWNGHSFEVVFSYEQGKKLRRAFNFARDKQASCSQQKLKNIFK